jgi:hypothetical protein
MLAGSPLHSFSILVFQFINFILLYFTISNITAISTIVAIISGVVGIYLGCKNSNEIALTEANRQDEQLFIIATNAIDEAIAIVENSSTPNDSSAWAVMAEQLSSFHNIAIDMSSSSLRRCYVGKLRSYMLRIKNIICQVDDFKFYFGVAAYKDKAIEALFAESYFTHINISPNVLGCLLQFLELFRETQRLDFIFHKTEIDKILTPVLLGFRGDQEYSKETISRLPEKFQYVHQYMLVWADQIAKYRSKS